MYQHAPPEGYSGGILLHQAQERFMSSGLATYTSDL